MSDVVQYRDVITVTSTPRPRRVCFLVNPDTTTNDELDQIVSYSVSRWGGRLFGIFPTNGDSVPSEWWKALVTVDPDVLYSLIPLSPNLIRKINREIYPAYIYWLDDEKRKRFGDEFLIQEDEIKAIGISGLPKTISERPPWGREPSFIIPTTHRPFAKDHSIIARNIGILSQDVSTENAFKGLTHIPIDLKNATDMAVIESVIKAGSGALTPLNLCRYRSKRSFSMKPDRFSPGFHLVIGDSPYDLMYYWNRGLVEESGSSTGTFWLPAKYAEKEEWIKIAAKWCQTFFWPADYARFGKVVSYSLDTTQLEKIAKEFSRLTYLHHEPILLKKETFPFPADDFLPPLRGSQIDQVTLSDKKALISIEEQSFLTDIRSDWGWMVDYQIQHRPELYSHTNLRPFWELPKKMGLADHFFYPARETRIVTGGLPSTFVKQNEKALEIHVPSDQEIVYRLLNKDRRNYRSSEAVPSSRFQHFRISPEGKALRGIIQLVGGLDVCRWLFSNTFWRRTLVEMSGKLKGESENRTIACKKALNEVLKDGPLTISAESESLNTLAKLLSERLSPVEPAPRELSKKELISRFNNMKSTAIAASGPDVQWWQHQAFDDIEIQDLTNRGILQQGVQLKCKTCGSTYWYRLNGLSAEVNCQGCFESIEMQFDAEWRFRVNDLLQNAFKYRGTLPVIEFLSEADFFKSPMFMYYPSIDIYEGVTETVFTDIDVFALRGGRFIIAEVKASPQGFKEEDFEKMAVLAENIEPHDLMFIATGKAWPDNFILMLKKITERLTPFDVKVTAKLLSWD